LLKKHSGQRSFENFTTNFISGLAAYCFLVIKPSLNLDVVDKKGIVTEDLMELTFS